MQDSKPMSKMTPVFCYNSEVLPHWFFCTDSTYEHCTDDSTYEEMHCNNSCSSQCYYKTGQSTNKTLQLPLNYDDEDDLRTSTFRCGLIRGNAIQDDCWIIKITIEHRQGKRTTRNLNNETPSSYFFRTEVGSYY